MEKFKKALILTGAIVGCIIFGYFCWKLERRVNWKFSYGAKVEKRIEKLEKKIATLETDLEVVKMILYEAELRSDGLEKRATANTSCNKLLLHLVREGNYCRVIQNP